MTVTYNTACQVTVHICTPSRCLTDMEPEGYSMPDYATAVKHNTACLSGSAGLYILYPKHDKMESMRDTPCHYA